MTIIINKTLKLDCNQNPFLSAWRHHLWLHKRWNSWDHGNPTINQDWKTPSVCPTSQVPWSVVLNENSTSRPTLIRLHTLSNSLTNFILDEERREHEPTRTISATMSKDTPPPVQGNRGGAMMRDHPTLIVMDKDKVPHCKNNDWFRAQKHMLTFAMSMPIQPKIGALRIRLQGGGRTSVTFLQFHFTCFLWFHFTFTSSNLFLHLDLGSSFPECEDKGDKLNFPRGASRVNHQVMMMISKQMTMLPQEPGQGWIQWTVSPHKQGSNPSFNDAQSTQVKWLMVSTNRMGPVEVHPHAGAVWARAKKPMQPRTWQGT